MPRLPASSPSRPQSDDSLQKASTAPGRVTASTPCSGTAVNPRDRIAAVRALEPAPGSGNIPSMDPQRRPPVLDMTPEGEFRDPAPPPAPGKLDRLRDLGGGRFRADGLLLHMAGRWRFSRTMPGRRMPWPM